MSINPKDIPTPSFEGEPLEFVVEFTPAGDPNDFDYVWKVETQRSLTR